LKTLQKLNLKIYFPQEPTRGNSTLDFMICGSSIEEVISKCYESPSDHKIIQFSLKLKPPCKLPRPKIPNSKLGISLTQKAFEESNDCAHFIDSFRKLKLQNRGKLSITPHPKIFKNELANLLIHADLDVNVITSGYWRYVNARIESMRFSRESKEAFQMMRSVYKYHLKRKDGEIINTIVTENKIVTNPTEIDQILATELSKIQIRRDLNLSPISFIPLPKPEPELMSLYLSQISSGKAVSWNLMSDIFLTKPYLDLSAKKLLDIWSLDWNAPQLQDHLMARMVFLNKKFPDKPGPQDFRPITILSPSTKSWNRDSYLTQRNCPEYSPPLPNWLH